MNLKKNIMETKKIGELFDDAVDRWHKSDTELTLVEYLGLTDESYGSWLRDPVRFEFWRIIEDFKDEFIRNRELIFNKINGHKQALVFCNEDHLKIFKNETEDHDNEFSRKTWRYSDFYTIGKKADLIVLQNGIVFHFFVQDISYPFLVKNTFIEIKE